MKRIVLFAIALALVGSSVSAALIEHYKTPFDFPRRYGVERVTHYDPRVNFARIDTSVYLEPSQVEKYKGVGRGGYAPFYARGSARLRSTVWAGSPKAQVTLKTRDLPMSERVNSQFEAWLVDTDSGYRLSLGTFTTLFGGIGELRYVSTTYLDPYDIIEVTMEPYDDLDVRPGPPVLVAVIPRPVYFDPAPKQAKLMTSSFKEI